MIKEPRLELRERLIELKILDFKAGHWLGTKNPPLGLNEMFLSKYPELMQRIGTLLPQMSADEEVELFRAFELHEGVQEFFSVKLHKDAKRPDAIYLYAYPDSREWYDEDDL